MSGKLFTICLLSWKKPENLSKIIAAFREQTFGDLIQFYIWNNNPDVDLNDYIKSIRALYSPIPRDFI